MSNYEKRKNSVITENAPSVAILLAHYNGEKYIREQLNSLQKQTYQNINIYISDDCSTGKSFEHLRWLVKKQNKFIRLKRNNQNRGHTKTFLSIPKTLGTVDFYAFCDQDDIWREDKIERSVLILKEIEKKTPSLYCSRTEITDQNGKRVIALSPLYKKPPSFKNALAQNIGGGNTMVFNSAASDLICQTANNIDLVAHDWWAYIIVTGAGGSVYYDQIPTLKYRQHGANVIGFNGSWAARFIRLKKLLTGEYKLWNDKNIEALKLNQHLLTPENRNTLRLFDEARKSKLWPRLILFKKSGVHRQTFISQVLLWLAIILGKI
ncbi:glycosyltransferase family 2 protein [Alphaproteobacteria bacterium]|nr:glycosyltransferase family 2 protein [Alphaproteobacteria bacterium]